MAALANPFNRKQVGGSPAPASVSLPMAAAAILMGAMVGVNGAGYLEKAQADSSKRLKIAGVASDTVDNSAGAAGAQSLKVLRGTFPFANGTSTDALTVADIERICYALDDNTVVRTPALGARPIAGRVKKIDTDGTVWVDLCDQDEGAQGGIDLLIVAGADLSAKQFFFVKQNASDQIVLCSAAGEEALGVLQNAPVNGAVGVVRVFGKSRVIAGAAITQGVKIATDANGKAKLAARLVQATGAASCALGRALSGAAGDLSAFEAFINDSGTRGTTDA